MIYHFICTNEKTGYKKGVSWEVCHEHETEDFVKNSILNNMVDDNGNKRFTKLKLVGITN